MSVAKTANEASVLKRMASILNLFSEGRTSITIDEVGEAIGVSPATAYRYVGELGGIGLLSRVSGRYVLGPKIIELEYLIRSYDPVIKSGEEIMTGMADMTGCHVLLCNIYNETIVNVFHAEGKDSLKVTFTKGKQMPLFRGSQARVILASLDRRKLRRLYDKHLENPDLMMLGRDWPSFRTELQRVRRQGYYISRDELDPDTTGIAAPVFNENNEVLGSLVLVFASSRTPWLSETALVQIVVENAREISRRVASLAEKECRNVQPSAVTLTRV
ncbi:MAG TPA: IclR family transcriptional regulator [Acidobacteriaceae bacterium]|jgi:DNA-binding IclR family transcriptional regulator|nr:IclR family transcriptional regulator [Acidobacteriaceae bacterium]